MYLQEHDLLSPDKLSAAVDAAGAEARDVRSCKGYQKKSETDAAGSKEADAGNRHWYKIATGVEITAGTEQAGTQREKPQEKRGRRAANV